MRFLPRTNAAATLATMNKSREPGTSARLVHLRHLVARDDERAELDVGQSLQRFFNRAKIGHDVAPASRPIP